MGVRVRFRAAKLVIEMNDQQSDRPAARAGFRRIRKSATESAPPETATPARSPGASIRAVRMRLRTRFSSEFADCIHGPEMPTCIHFSSRLRRGRATAELASWSLACCVKRLRLDEMLRSSTTAAKWEHLCALVFGPEGHAWTESAERASQHLQQTVVDGNGADSGPVGVMFGTQTHKLQNPVESRPQPDSRLRMPERATTRGDSSTFRAEASADRQ